MQKSLVPSAWVVLLAATAATACSSDPDGPGAGGAGGAASSGGVAATGGATVTGGSPGSGASAGSGGAATGGGTSYDAAAVAACGIGDTDCLSCLAVSCCDTAKACLDEAACAGSFAAYQTCVGANPDDASRCYSVFAAEVLGDGGAETHQPLLECIFNIADLPSSCTACGVPSAL